jgi:membrane-bound serine protease (ClpP class)
MLLRFFLVLFLLQAATQAAPAIMPSETSNRPGGVYVVEVRDDIMLPMTYLIRRGVKEAMEAKADLLVLDMETNGGRVDVTEDIIGILGRFPGETATYVNRKAFSAGAFIAVATKRIYMAPQSVIGAAAPILMMPGAGVEKIPETLEAKMTSGIKALVRATAKKNGHNPDVIEAMIDRTKELTIDEEVLNKEGQILTLDDEQAARLYGEPAKPLLSSGTFESLDTLLVHLGYDPAARRTVQPTGAEKLGSWINAISPILLIIGMAGLYLEFKTPGFGLPGILGISAFVLYFFGGYVAGLAGLEWLAVFVLGVLLVVLELLVFPGTVLLGLGGAFLMLLALLMGMADVYPTVPGLPGLPHVTLPVGDLVIAFLGSVLTIYLLSLWLPRSSLYDKMVSARASGMSSIKADRVRHQAALGKTGIALSTLRPGGKARFGGEIQDAVASTGFIERGQPVRIVAFSGQEAVVEPAAGSAEPSRVC